MITQYAEQLIARHEKPVAVFWHGRVRGVETRLKLIDRNDYFMCLVEWPDGNMTTMHWIELNRRFKAMEL